MNRVLNISTFFKDAHSKGIICYSKEWLDFINKLDSAQLLELKIFFLCVTNKIKYKGGKKGYTLPQTQAKIRYVRVFPQDGIEQLLLVPNFPGFDEFMCQIHIGTVELSLDEITEFAKKLWIFRIDLCHRFRSNSAKIFVSICANLKKIGM